MAEPLFGLIGETLKHSWSVPIHQALGCDAYRLYELKPEELEGFLTENEIGGLNHTGAERFVQMVAGYLELLGQNGFVIPLHLLQVAGSVDNAVQEDAVTAEQPADLAFRPEGGRVDPDLISLDLEFPDQFRGAEAKAFAIDVSQRKRKRRLRFMRFRRNEQHLVQVKGYPHFAVLIRTAHFPSSFQKCL